MQYSRLAALIDNAHSNESETVSIPVDLFRSIVSAALKSKGIFDEDYYVSINGDIKSAIAKRMISGASDHYFATGYFEGRMPTKIMVDEKFYLENNLDVAAAIRRGTIQSAQDHFDYTGFKEGRLPYKDFSLF